MELGATSTSDASPHHSSTTPLQGSAGFNSLGTQHKNKEDLAVNQIKTNLRRISFCVDKPTPLVELANICETTELSPTLQWARPEF